MMRNASGSCDAAPASVFDSSVESADFEVLDNDARALASYGVKNDTILELLIHELTPFSEEDVLAIVIAAKERRMEDLERLLGEHGGELDLSDCAPVWRHADVDRFDEDDIAAIPNALHNNATVTEIQLPGVWSAGYAIDEPLLEMMQHNSYITAVYADCDDCGPNDVMEQVFRMCTTNLLNSLADRLPFNAVTEIELSYVNDAHIAALATAMRDNTSVTTISLSEISTRDGFDPSPVVTDAGVAQLLALARNHANITRIDVDDAKFFCSQGKLDAGLWATVQAACEANRGAVSI